jgi:UDP-N-acetylmuramoyl-L-alanyl-D-glutamate--2,6-diaminopimelate ligase
MLLLGVTGTNGKTTTTHFLESILLAAGYETGLIGTIYTRFRGVQNPNRLTSPDSPELQKTLRSMSDSGVEACVMELSSHALSLKRLEGSAFNGVGITNITHDHLDFHRTFEAYREAKLSITGLLRDEAGPRFVVANYEEPWFPEVKARVSSPVITFGLTTGPDVFPLCIRGKAWGSLCQFRTPVGDLVAEVRLPGLHNVSNALTAVAFAVALGIHPAAIASGIEALDTVPGRFQPVGKGRFRGIVDFAHNPDGLAKFLATARSITRGKIILVFGCQGQRDVTKRPIMGSIAAKLADETILTIDDLYNEEPGDIAGMIMEGYLAVRREGLSVIWRRDQAIEEAVSRLQEDGLVLVAGRGPERRLVIGTEVYDFDDADYLADCLELKERGHCFRVTKNTV